MIMSAVLPPGSAGLGVNVTIDVWAELENEPSFTFQLIARLSSLPASVGSAFVEENVTPSSTV
jgi:hypothetical protein